MKHQRGDASKPIHDDGSINYDNFQIIGQSYAWRSTEGDLCLDSIEHLRNSIPADVLKHMLTQFGQEVLASDSSMMRVHVGLGGGTPRSLFSETRDALEMKQGVMYGDAEMQYVIAQSPELMLAEHPVLKGRWKAWQDENHDMNTEPRRFLNFLSTLSSLELTQVLKAKNVNGQTLLHAAASGILPFNVSDLLRYYADDVVRRDAVMMKDRHGETLLHRAAENPKSLKMILSLYPEDARLAAVQEKDWDGQTLLHKAAENPEFLKMILSLLPEDARLIALKLAMQKIRPSVFWQEKPLEINILLDLLRPSDIFSLAKDRSVELSNDFKVKLVGMTQKTELKQQIMDAKTHEAMALSIEALEVELAARKEDPGLSLGAYRR